MSDHLLNERDVAQLLGISVSWLRQQRMLERVPGPRKGPRFVRLGRAVRYRRTDLDQWIEANLAEGERA